MGRMSHVLHLAQSRGGVIGFSASAGWLVCQCYNLQILNHVFNPFPHIDTALQQTAFENIVTKEEIAQNQQFLLLLQCFPLLVIGYPFNYRDILFFDKKPSAAELLYEGKD